MITLYTKPNCDYCERAKKYLNENNLKFTVIDITEDRSAYEFLKKENHKTVPQIYHNGKLLVEGGATALLNKDPQILKEQLGDIDVSKFEL
jgi:glutaredoxin